MYDLISWLLVAGTHLQTLVFIVGALMLLPLFLTLDFMDVMGGLSILGLIFYVCA